MLNGDSQLWQITSPIFTLPTDIINETLHFFFWLRNDMLDGDGNGDGFLDDFSRYHYSPIPQIYGYQPM